MSPLLIQEPPLQVLPSLAIKIGLNEAIVLQQLHYLLREPRFGRRIAEHQWIFNTVEQWRASYFPFWSENTISRTFASLRDQCLVVTCQPEGAASRRLYYRIDQQRVSALELGNKPFHQIGGMEDPKLVESNPSKWALPITKTTCKDFSKEYLSKESKETSALPTRDVLATPDETFPAMWKEDKRTKEEKLAALRMPKDYPSERTFTAFLEDNDLDGILCKRDNLFSTLTDSKWHHWTGRQWTKIKDWKAYVTAFNAKLDSFEP